MVLVKSLILLGAIGLLSGLLSSLVTAMFFSSYTMGIVIGVFWLLGSAAYFFFAFYKNEDFKKKIAYCILGGSSVIGALTMIIVDSKKYRDREHDHYYGWHIESRVTLATFVYCLVSMCFGEVLATGFAFVGSFLGLEDLFSAAGYDRTIEIGIFSAVNLIINFFAGIAMGQGKKHIHWTLGASDQHLHNLIWRTGFCYTIALWFFSAGAYVLLGFLLEKRAGGGSGMTDPMAAPAYDAGESKGGYTSIN